MKSLARRSFCSLFMILLVSLFLSVSLVNAKSITRLSGIPELEILKGYYSIPNFKIGGTYEFGNEASYDFGGKGGVTLESLGQKPLRTSYIAVGTPKRDANGKIINAVILNSYYSADSSMMFFFWYDGQKGNAFAGGAVVGPGKQIDTNKYYVIFLDALGLWGASKPSDGLGMKFPKYSNLDYVQANYRLLKDGLGVAKVKLSTGASMGAIQSYIWAILHPDFVEAIMPIAGATAMDPVSRWLFQLMTAAMQSDPVWQKTKGNYYHLPKEKHPNKGMMFGWSVLGETGLSFDFRNKQPWDAVKKEVFYWQPKGDEGANLISKGKDFDVNDLLYRNMAGDTFNINDQLQRIKAKTMIIGVKTDQWLRYAMAEESAKKIPGAKLVGYEHPLAHYAAFAAFAVMKNEVAAFFKEIGME
jgi:homoserine O-acetyltransferase